MNHLIDRLNALADLQDGWDGHNGDAPEEETISNTRFFLKNIPNFYIEKLDAYDITPTSYGTVTLQWQNEIGYVSVEIGREEFAYFCKVGDIVPLSSNNQSLVHMDGVIHVLDIVYGR